MGLAHGGGRDAGEHHVHEQLLDVQHAGAQQPSGELVVVQVLDGHHADDERHQPVEQRVERFERQPGPVDAEPGAPRVLARDPSRGDGRENAEQVRAHVQGPVQFHGADGGSDGNGDVACGRQTANSDVGTMKSVITRVLCVER